MFEVLWAGEGMFGVDSRLKSVCVCVCVRQVPTCPPLCLLLPDTSNHRLSWWALSSLSLLFLIQFCFYCHKEKDQSLKLVMSVGSGGPTSPSNSSEQSEISARLPTGSINTFMLLTSGHETLQKSYFIPFSTPLIWLTTWRRPPSEQTYL